MKPEGAPKFPNCNLCCTSLEEAARMLPAAHIFELAVGIEQLFDAKNLLRVLCAGQQDNIFAPYLSLKVEATYTADEWSLRVGDSVVWSAGA